ncbi:hypothetical protein [Rhizobium phaseoli]|uniref:hypothetical protein n=1 Tax=Rhizobium phaseoli TaxID=396 RepID=UPI0007E96B48|nr:hypothetical protein [Rhizobium phaseoli]ANL38314.1 hypothetical protein AMC89_PD00856 [Rhizobium phaseoli]
MTGVALDRLQRALKDVQGQDRGDLASLLQYVRIVVSNDELISQDPRVNGTLINMLANATSTPDYSVRIQGGWLLANLTNKNNVCGIVDTLFNSNLDFKARGNLLEIVGKLTTQLQSDVAGWLKTALDRPTEYRDTRADMMQAVLAGRLASPETLKDSSPRDFATCVNLPNIGSTYVGEPSDNAAYSVYIHAGNANSAEVAKVREALVKAGFNVKGDDKEVDLAGTGVDYSLKGADSSLALSKAAAISSIVYQSISRTIGTRGQSLTPIGAFGVWL